MQLCRRMNYRKTADALGITQPAVTQQIHYLEREYGGKLFTYEKSQLKKTAEAEILEQYARAMCLQDKHLWSKLSNTVVRESNIVYLKHADLQEEIDWFFRKEADK